MHALGDASARLRNIVRVWVKGPRRTTAGARCARSGTLDGAWRQPCTSHHVCSVPGRVQILDTHVMSALIRRHSEAVFDARPGSTSGNEW